MCTWLHGKSVAGECFFLEIFLQNSRHAYTKYQTQIFPLFSQNIFQLCNTFDIAAIVLLLNIHIFYYSMFFSGSLLTFQYL